MNNEIALASLIMAEDAYWDEYYHAVPIDYEGEEE